MKDVVNTMFRTLVIAVALLLFGFSAVNAQQTKDPRIGAGRDTEEFGHRGHGGWMMRILSHLDLTPAQETEIQAILAEQRPKVRPLVDELRKNREELRSISKDGAFDETQVRAIATRQAKVLAELIVAKQQVKSKIYAVLTPEQRAQAEKLFDLLKPRNGRFGHGDM